MNTNNNDVTASADTPDGYCLSALLPQRAALRAATR